MPDIKLKKSSAASIKQFHETGVVPPGMVFAPGVGDEFYDVPTDITPEQMEKFHDSLAHGASRSVAPPISTDAPPAPVVTGTGR